MKKYKIGDVIYPFNNGSTGFLKRRYWEVIIKIDKKGDWIDKELWYSMETAILRSQIIKLKQELKK